MRSLQQFLAEGAVDRDVSVEKLRGIDKELVRQFYNSTSEMVARREQPVVETGL